MVGEMKRLWCMRCCHGVEGIEGEYCPQCVSKGREENDRGILMTPMDAEEKIRIRAEAIKEARKKNISRPYKTDDEKLEEMRQKIMKEIRENFVIKPKTEVETQEVKRGPGRPKVL